MSENGSLGTSEISAGPTQRGPGGTNLPLILSANQGQGQNTNRVKALPKLPSHRFRYTVWHELSSTNVTGNQLKAPRIRDGPEIKDKFFYKIRDESCRRIHHNRRGAARKSYQSSMENWENTTVANLSYQELQHSYQKENFIRVLKRLIRVEHLTCIHNEIVDLSSVSLPCCKYFDASTGHMESLKHLPKLPRVEVLILDDNHILNLSGLEKLARYPLKYLSMKGTPVSFSLNYRQRIFESLPQLLELDDVPKQPDDEIFDEEPETERTCVIS